MSEQNVEVVRSLLGPFQGINVAEIDWGSEPIREVIAAGSSPEIELRTLESGMGAGVDPVYNGVDGVVSYLRAWMEPFTDYRVDWLDFIDEGEFVLVPVSNRGIGSGSGVPTELELVYACEVKDGLVTRILQYDTLDDAREAIASSQ
jgi:hypothetical protein